MRNDETFTDLPKEVSQCLRDDGLAPHQIPTYGCNRQIQGPSNSTFTVIPFSWLPPKESRVIKLSTRYIEFVCWDPD
jgi:hypothetical protein